MEQRVSLVTLGVADHGAARAFYERLGWHCTLEVEETAFFQTGCLVVALWSRDKLAADSGVTDGGGWGGVTLAHNVRSALEVDRVLDQAQAAGAAIARAPARRLYRRVHRPRRPSLGGRLQSRLRAPR